MKVAHDALAIIEKEFARIGLLLQHDRELPSFTTLVAGAPIAGSWWGHRLGHEIFRLLGEFHERSGELSAKIVNGKVTYVHPRLWSAFLKLALQGQRTRARKLSSLGRSIHRLVLKDESVRIDELAATGFAPQRALTAATLA